MSRLDVSPKAIARRRYQPRPPRLEAVLGGGGQLREGLHRVGDLAQEAATGRAHLAGEEGLGVARPVVPSDVFGMARSGLEDFWS